MDTRQSTRFRQIAGPPPATDLRPWELCWHTDGKLYIGVRDTDGHATAVQQISGAGASVAWGDLTGIPAYATRWPTWSEVTSKPTFGSMAYVDDAPSDSTGYVRKNGVWSAASGGAASTSANLIRNSNAQFGTEDWNTAGSSISVVTHLDRKCWQVTQAAGFGYIADDVALASAETGKTYSFAADIAGNVSGTPAIIMVFQNASGVPLGTYVTNISISDTFERFKIEGKSCPSGTAKIRCQIRTSGSSDTFYFGRAKLERSDVATPFSEEPAVQENAQKVASADVTEIVVTSTTPSSNSANSGKLYLVY